MYLSQNNYPQGLSVCILGGILGTVLHQLQHKMTTLRNILQEEVGKLCMMPVWKLLIEYVTDKTKEMSIKS